MLNHPLLNAELEKYAREPMKKGLPNWTLNSRNLIAACIYGKMGQTVPRGSKDKIPSIAAPILEKMDIPFARVLKEFRSKSHTVTSISSSIEHIRDASAFGPYHPGERRVRIIYTVLGFGNVERVFTPPKDSLPISADKRVRYAIGITNPPMLKTDEEKHAPLLAFLPLEEIVEQGETSV